MSKEKATEVHPDTSTPIGVGPNGDQPGERGTSSLPADFYKDQEPLVPETEAFTESRTVEVGEPVLEPATKQE